jgi:hypothetical protein
MTAFGAAIDTLFADPALARDALWRLGGTGDGTTVRVIRKRPDQVVGFGDSRAVVPTVLIDVRRVEVPTPASGDTLEIEGEIFAVIATPTIDAERLIWTCEVSPQG